MTTSQSGHLDGSVGPAAQPASSTATRAGNETRAHVRGSSLLLMGRGLSLLANFAVQVVIVRYLAKTEYGAFAYALSIATLAAGLTTAGLDRAVPRFLPIYDEARDDSRLVGTIAVAVTTILGLGLALVLAVIGLQGWLTGAGVGDSQAIALLVILIALAPLQALDDLQTGLLAVISTPKAIFVRRYILTPGLRVLVVALLAATGGTAAFLAFGYVAAAALGVVIYGFVVWRILRDRGYIRRALAGGVRFPVRDVFSFALPLLSTDLLYLAIGASDVIVLGYAHGATAVADLRAVQPLAMLNQVVLSSFTLLYMPLAARLFARDDRAGAQEAYWQTAVWIATLSFPIFAVTFSLAGPLTILLFGPAYASSGVILAILAVGYYANAALGFNGLTLKIHGRIRLAVGIDLGAMVLNVVAILLLVPPFGAVGAAVGTATTLVVHNVLKQAALRRATGIALFDGRSALLYGALALTAAALGVIAVVVRPPLVIGGILVGVASLIVLAIGRERLDIAAIFPEIRSIPILRRLAG
ncbi:MAG TPA: flippase [Candidatus Limnocylindrales bacterium]|nr:flippase [Candidatus Limnocylindrales bacterium]